MIRIVTDTLACLPQVYAETYKIPVIPQVIIFGEESFREGIDMNHQDFLARLKQSKDLPKTAAPSPEWFKETFRELAAEAETILCIHPSAEMSGTVRSATVAAQDFPELDIRVIDTRVIAYPLGVMVMLANKWVEKGLKADEIIQRLEGLSRKARIYFLVDTLEYLARGGRIGNASALLGTLLQIKPILTLNDGKVDLFQRERTYKRAWEFIKSRLNEEYPGQGEDYGFLNVMHAGAQQEAEEAANELKKMFGLKEIPIIDLPPAIITHAGPGTIAVDYFVR